MKQPSALAAVAELKPGANLTLASTPDGFDAIALADSARAIARAGASSPVTLVHVARDGQRMAALEAGLAFVAPEIETLGYPAWDCQPYDRVGPSAPTSARRMTTLSRLARTRPGDRPRVLLTTVNAVLQRATPRGRMEAETFSAAPGHSVDMDHVVQWLERNGFMRTGAVRDVGEYALRGGILDLYPAGLPTPVRLDFFGDTLESIRAFDPETQRTTGQQRALDLVPMSEVTLTTESIKRFRQAYLATFGAVTKSDPLYEAISEGRRYPGLEHWLPLFAPDLGTIFDYVGEAVVALDAHAEDAAGERLSQIADYHEARASALAQGSVGSAAPYKPLAPDALYLSPSEWAASLAKAPVARVTSFALPPDSSRRIVDLGARQGRSFAPERADESANVFDAAVAHIRALQAQKKRVIVASWSDGSRERLATVLADHELSRATNVAALSHVQALRGDEVGLAVWGLEAGFETPDLAVVAEQDILGDRLVRAKGKKRRASDFIAEATSLMAGDLVVHVDHGIARFLGLKAIEVGGAPHDCAELEYAGGDKLFLPVENIELLSRYGSDETAAALDRLGGGGWQARKARLKERIREMAGKLMAIAAQRAMKEAPRLTPPDGIYDEFRARFPYEETDDQQASIDATLDDLAAGKPMDRLICGDVGFGKTEVALRAAFAVALNGRQVAVVVPTTLLARQHFKTFSDRFRGLPVRVAQASRFVASADLKKVKEGLADGSVDIV
ncbi:MAG: CarD family transcriptional regulator, partial [Beijerinckiaceae bacterium]